MLHFLFRRPNIRSTRQALAAPVAAETLEDRIVLSASALLAPAGATFDTSFVTINEVTVNDIEVTSDTEIVANTTIEGTLLGSDFTQDVQIPLTVESSAGLEASEVSITAITISDAELTDDNKLVIGATVEGTITGEDFSQETQVELNLDSTDGPLVTITEITVNQIEATSDTEIIADATITGTAFGTDFTQDVQIPITVESSEGLEAGDVSITAITVNDAQVTEEGELAINATVEGSVAETDFTQETSLLLNVGDDGEEDNEEDSNGTPGPVDALQDVLERLTDKFEDRFDDEKFDKIVGRFADHVDAMVERFEERADRRAERASDRIESIVDRSTDRISRISDRATDRIEEIADRNDDLFAQGDLLDRLATGP